MIRPAPQVRGSFRAGTLRRGRASLSAAGRRNTPADLISRIGKRAFCNRSNRARDVALDVRKSVWYLGRHRLSFNHLEDTHLGVLSLSPALAVLATGVPIADDGTK